MNDRASADESSRAARRFGLVSLPVALVGTALVVFLRTGATTAALACAGAAAASAATACLAPSALCPLHRAARRVGEAAATLLTWALLAAVYFTAFAAASLLARAVGYDAMGRRLDRHARSYWVRREPAPESLERWFDPH